MEQADRGTPPGTTAQTPAAEEAQAAEEVIEMKHRIRPGRAHRALLFALDLLPVAGLPFGLFVLLLLTQMRELAYL